MNRRAIRLALACLALVVFTSCRTGGQIYNVTDTPITTPTGKEPSLDQVTKAIIGAGQSRRWSMAVIQPGQIVGTVSFRSHQIIVDIPYTTKSYSIKYKNSLNLNYDSAKQTIHNTYADWIKELDFAIQARLSTIGSEPTIH